MTRSRQQVAVVGAGIAGRLTALRLAAANHHVTVYERRASDRDDAASFVAAGMLTPIAESVHAASEVRAWGQRSLALWPGIIAQLAESVPFTVQGSLVLIRPGDRSELEDFLSLIKRRSPSAKVELLSTKEVATREPGLAGTGLDGALIEGEGQIDNIATMKSLAKTLIEGGVELRFDGEVDVSAYQVRDIASGKSLTYDWVFDCRGLGACADLKDLRGVRGEAILLDAPEVHLTRPVRILHQRYPLYVVPRGSGRFVVGATEIESDDEGPISVTSALELLGAAYSLSDGFRFARIVGLNASVRPAFSDHKPRVLSVPGLTRINGLYRHGYLLGPLVVDAAVRLFDGEALEPDLLPLTEALS